MSEQTKKPTSNTQYCKLCNPPLEFGSYYGWAKHRKEVHGIEPRVTKPHSDVKHAGLFDLKDQAEKLLKTATKDREELVKKLEAVDKTIKQCTTVIDNL